MRMTYVLAALAAAILFLAGCRTPERATGAPLVYGERVFVKQAGESLTLPPLVPPAKVWYIADDIGLGSWLGLDAPDTSEVSVSSVHSGRSVGKIGASYTVSPRFGSPAAVASVLVKLDNVGTGDVTLYSVQSRVTNIRMAATIDGAESVLFHPDNLWLRTGDSVIVSNTTGEAGTCVIDYAQ